MNNKRKTKILLYAVIAVWAGIGVRAIMLLNPSTIEVQAPEFAIKTDFKLNTKIDTFSIRQVDRDPFLGTILKKEAPKTNKKQSTISWKPITYHGSIKGKSNSKNVYIISINGKQVLLKKGQSKDSITLVYGNTKQIRLKYKNRTKTFQLKQ